ncbi:AraC family transcriptional regulator [Streptomyces albogriseolus]
MGLHFETRHSDSPWVDSVWTCTGEQVSTMTSVAGTRLGLVFWRQDGRSYAAVTGPETRTGTAPVSEGATFTGIEFAVGSTLRMVPTAELVDGGVALPDTSHRTFRLDGARWETPGPDDAEALVGRMVRAGVLARDPFVADMLRGHRPAVSQRTVERRFRAATGLTRAPYGRSSGRARRRSCWRRATRRPTSPSSSTTSTSRIWPGPCGRMSGGPHGSCVRARAVRSASTSISA